MLYQIAILGRRDLGLAPDEYAGFTMTLMRMLAFVPVEPRGKVAASPLPGRPAAYAAVTRAVDQPRVMEKTNQPVADTRPIEAELSDWGISSGASGRRLGAHARQQLSNSGVCKAQYRPGRTRRRTSTWWKKPTTNKLQAALGDYFDLANCGCASRPAAGKIWKLKTTEQQAKLAKAIESIDADPFVRELVENFDARVKDTSIKPVQ